MSDPLILSGKDVSQSVYGNLKDRISVLKSKNITPGLAVVLVGDDPASQVYIRSKTKKFNQLGLNTESHRLSIDTSEKDLLNLIDQLNQDNQFHGILVQLPLPGHIDTQKVLEAMDPKKDVVPAHQKGSCASCLIITLI